MSDCVKGQSHKRVQNWTDNSHSFSNDIDIFLTKYELDEV